MSRGGAASDDRLETSGQAATGESPAQGAAPAASVGGRVEHRNGAARARAGRPGPNGAAVPVAVTWDDRVRRPVAFVWRRRRYRVERVLETWVLETGWWKDEGHISRSYWRVRAGGRVLDLRYDRLSKAWAIEREIG